MNQIEKKSIVIDLILTVLTFGLFNIWVQYREIRDINSIIGRDEIPSFLVVIFFSLITFGIYFWYHEYRLTKRLHQLNYNKTIWPIEVSLACLTYVGMWFIVDSYQQFLINEYLDRSKTLLTTN